MCLSINCTNNLVFAFTRKSTLLFWEILLSFVRHIDHHRLVVSRFTLTISAIFKYMTVEYFIHPRIGHLRCLSIWDDRRKRSASILIIICKIGRLDKWRLLQSSNQMLMFVYRTRQSFQRSKNLSCYMIRNKLSAAVVNFLLREYLELRVQEYGTQYALRYLRRWRELDQRVFDGQDWTRGIWKCLLKPYLVSAIAELLQRYCWFGELEHS